jgi:hypothetical protein
MTVINEPPIKTSDTQPRRPVTPYPDADERRGCANPLLTTIVALMLLGMFVTMVGLAAFAGYRDGGQIRRTQNAVAVVGTMDGQATLAWQDLGSGNFELADVRCKYVIEINPQYPGMRNCVSTAQAGIAALNATPTFPPTPLPTLTLTPTVPPSPVTPTGITAEVLFARADGQIARQDDEAARRTLEALRGLDINFRRPQVEEKLVDVYLRLAQKYETENRIAEMIVVVAQAEKIRSLQNTKWPFTAYAAQLYLSAKGYYQAQNYALASQVFRNMFLSGAQNFLDTRQLGCDAFSKAGDTAAIAQYCQ